VACRLFAEGRNAVQVQRWLGHHWASFTLDYVHQLDSDLGEPLTAKPSTVLYAADSVCLRGAVR